LAAGAPSRLTIRAPKSDYFSTQIKNSPARTGEFSTSWRLDETTTPDNTWVVGAVISFSDYFSDYKSWLNYE
jgi:hypothetical protein